MAVYSKCGVCGVRGWRQSLSEPCGECGERFRRDQAGLHVRNIDWGRVNEKSPGIPTGFHTGLNGFVSSRRDVDRLIDKHKRAGRDLRIVRG